MASDSLGNIYVSTYTTTANNVLVYSSAGALVNTIPINGPINATGGLAVAAGKLALGLTYANEANVYNAATGGAPILTIH